jgi:hypothetical protein
MRRMASDQPWHLGELRQRVTARFGSDQLAKLRPPLDSLEQRWRIARYHYYVVKRLVAGLAAWSRREGHLFAIVLGSAEQRARLDSVSLKITANVLACLQSLHAVADTFAHAAYFSLALDQDPTFRTPIERLSIKTLLSAMLKTGQYPKLAESVCDLITHQDFCHIEAIVNHSKHRSIIEPNLHADGVEGISDDLTITFPRIDYKGSIYPERPVATFLEGEYVRENLLYIRTIGPLLNDYLA